MDEKCEGCGADMTIERTHWDGCHTSHKQCAAFNAGREAGMREAAKSCLDRIGVYSTESFERNAGANEALHEVGNAILSAIGGGK